MRKPTQTVIVYPLERRQIDDMSNNLQAVIDGSLFPAIFFAVPNVRFKSPHVNSVQRNVSDEGFQNPQQVSVSLNARFSGFVQVLSGGLSEGSLWSDSIDFSLPYLFHGVS